MCEQPGPNTQLWKRMSKCTSMSQIYWRLSSISSCSSQGLSGFQETKRHLGQLPSMWFKPTLLTTVLVMVSHLWPVHLEVSIGQDIHLGDILSFNSLCATCTFCRIWSFLILYHYIHLSIHISRTLKLWIC